MIIEIAKSGFKNPEGVIEFSNLREYYMGNMI